MTEQIARRRRGAALEDAILDAAWTELASQGYSNLTFEAVAKRAGTSRPVLYRRWRTRVNLASAAVARYITFNPVTVPDLGNVRDELCLLLRKYADRTPPKLMRLAFDMSADMAAEQTSFTDEQFRQAPLEGVLQRAVERGEIDKGRLTPCVLRAPLSLVLHEIVVTVRPISNEAIAEIVDQVVLPLVRRTSGVARSVG